MSERVTTEQQRTARQQDTQAAIAPARDVSPVPDELIRTEQWIQETRCGLTSRQWILVQF